MKQEHRLLEAAAASAGAEDSHTDAARSQVAFILPLLILVVLVLLVGGALTSRYKRALVRRGLSQVRTDMRSLAIGVESYYVDNMFYPQSTIVREQTPDGAHYGSRIPVAWTFRIRNGTDDHFNTITTPIAYLTSYPRDPFSGRAGLTYRYHCFGLHGWILGSYGPDFDYKTGGQLEWEQPPAIEGRSPTFDETKISGAAHLRVYLPDVERRLKYLPGRNSPAMNELIGGGGDRGAYSYDPTNGLLSAGDLWRVRQ